MSGTKTVFAARQSPASAARPSSPLHFDRCPCGLAGRPAIKLVVPFAPGGPTDIVARVLAQGLAEVLGGAAVVVENKAGAGGNIAIGSVARAEADGFTILVSSSAFLLNPSLYETVPYDPFKDFKPISLLTTSPNAFIADPGAGISSIAELIEVAKKDPDKLNYASPGIGTTPMLAFELLKIRAGIKATQVVFPGAGPAVQAVLSKTTQVGWGAAPGAPPDPGRCTEGARGDGRAALARSRTCRRWPRSDSGISCWTQSR